MVHLSLQFLVGLPTGPCAILVGVTPLSAGHHFEACVPRTFCLKNNPFKKGTNNELKLYQQRVECRLRWSSGALRAEDDNLSIKRRCSIRILRFELLILKDAFLRLIFAFVFVVPRKHANHEFSALAIRAFFVPSDQLPLGGGLQYGVEPYYVEDILSLKVVSLAIVRSPSRSCEIGVGLHK
jgi:hypothetical protein